MGSTSLSTLTFTCSNLHLTSTLISLAYIIPIFFPFVLYSLPLLYITEVLFLVSFLCPLLTCQLYILFFCPLCSSSGWPLIYNIHLLLISVYIQIKLCHFIYNVRIFQHCISIFPCHPLCYCRLFNFTVAIW